MTALVLELAAPGKHFATARRNENIVNAHGVFNDPRELGAGVRVEYGAGGDA